MALDLVGDRLVPSDPSLSRRRLPSVDGEESLMRFGGMRRRMVTGGGNGSGSGLHELGGGRRTVADLTVAGAGGRRGLRRIL